LNIPIQAIGVKPTTHIVSQNDSTQDLFFEPYNFRIGETYIVSGVTCNEFTGFTSTLPFYYLCPDEFIANSYKPSPLLNLQTISSIAPNQHTVLSNSNGRALVLPTIFDATNTPYHVTLSQSTLNYYFAGGSFTASNSSAGPIYQTMTQNFPNNNDQYSVWTN
jgi:hypothetical protein